MLSKQELLQLTKAELNVALTPYMGGYTTANLKRITKEQMADELLAFQEQQIQRPTTRRQNSKSGVIGEIVKSLDEYLSKKEILEILKQKFPDRNPEAMMKTINTQVPSRLKKKYKIDKQKRDGEYVFKIIGSL